MKINRTYNAKRNILSGAVLKFVQILLPFVMRTVMIYTIGVEFLGLNSLFASVLQVLNLAEMGVGNAMVFNMYKAIAEDDNERLCSLLGVYKKYYFRIGLFIAIVGGAITPMVNLFINGEIPNNLNIYIIYICHLSITVVTYWFFAYKTCVLNAYQRVDVVNKITLAVNFVQYAIQFWVLYFLRDYYLYVVVNVLSQILLNYIISVYVDKKYPLIFPKYDLDKRSIKDINQKIRDLFTAKLGGTIVGSADTLVISTVLGLVPLAIYQNYYFIMTSVISVVSILFNACVAGVGNSIAIESREKNYRDFRKFNFIVAWINTVCVSCFVSVYQPFMFLWTGGEYMFGMQMVIMLCVYFSLFNVQQLACMYKDAAGIWHSDRFRPFISSIVNLVLNIVFVKFAGVGGVLLATILSYVLVAMPWLTHNLFSDLFKMSSLRYITETVGYFLGAMVIATGCYFLCSFVGFGNYWEIIIKIFICVVFSNLMIFIFYKRNPFFNEVLGVLFK